MCGMPVDPVTSLLTAISTASRAGPAGAPSRPSPPLSTWCWSGWPPACRSGRGRICAWARGGGAFGRDPSRRSARHYDRRRMRGRHPAPRASPFCFLAPSSALPQVAQQEAGDAHGPAVGRPCREAALASQAFEGGRRAWPHVRRRLRASSKGGPSNRALRFFTTRISPMGLSTAVRTGIRAHHNFRRGPLQLGDIARRQGRTCSTRLMRLHPVEGRAICVADGGRPARLNPLLVVAPLLFRRCPSSRRHGANISDASSMPTSSVRSRE